MIVPPGYTASVLYAWGDPVSNGPEWDNQALDTWQDQEQQAGMHHDGMYFFPLPYGSTQHDRGLLVMNHEYVDHGLLFRDATANWSADKVRKSQAAHGVSVIEVAVPERPVAGGAALAATAGASPPTRRCGSRARPRATRRCGRRRIPRGRRSSAP